ncbi:MAG: nitroreductase family protein [Anaerolineae bacterium]|nr:nitroreductase family protein [Anaerolineae bacterium]MEB2287305.1 nitroreductase family protein [Anaerolineae bacterium]
MSDGMDATALLALMQTRRSVRRYSERPVSQTALGRLFEAARWAPSAHNRQPWRFAALVEPEPRLRLAEAMGARFRRDLLADGLAPDEVERQVARSVARIGGAPAVIVVFLSMADMNRYPDVRRQSLEREMAAQSVALAVQNMLLMAHAQGLGMCWMCAPLFCPDVVRETLGLPPDWEAQALLTVGYPAEARSKDRAPLEAKVRWF